MSYGMNGWNHDNDLVRRKDVMDSLVKEYNRRFSLGERNGLKLAWIEKAVNEVDVAQQGKIQLPEEDATKGATSDLISRAAVIREIMTDVRTDKTACLLHVNLICNRLEKLPSAQPKSYREGYQAGFKDAQPERVRGRWNPDSINGMKPYGYICNLCGAWQPVKRNYCPNCGADMREVSETDG